MLTPQSLTTIIQQLLPDPQASLLAGMLFGGNVRLERELHTALITTGTIHMVALSGTNVVIIIRVFGTLFLPFGRRVGSLLNLVWIILFVWFVGPSASVVRAAGMGGLTLLSASFGRTYYGLLSLAIVVIAMLGFNPDWITDVGFQLSVMATLGIMLMDRLDFSRWRVFILTLVVGLTGIRVKSRSQPSWLGRAMASLVSVFGEDCKATLAAELFTLPIVALTFHRISLISPLTNLLVGWVVPPLTVMGIFIVLISLIYLPLAQVLAWLAWAPLTYFTTVVLWTGTLPWAQVSF